jgi:hypothetical protein
LFSGENAQTEGLGAGIAVIARNSFPVHEIVGHRNYRRIDGRTDDVMCEVIHILGNSLSTYGAGHLVTATFGQWPIWSDEVKFFQKYFV